MIKKEKCMNMNHSKMNVLVRHCPMCGDFVNKAIAKKKCQNDEHIRRRKERSQFCTDCGIALNLK